MLFNMKKNKVSSNEEITMNEFKRLWNQELLNVVDKRDFSKVYNYALRKNNIRDICMKTYFDFKSEDSPRFVEACKAFDEGDVTWMYMLIRQFATIPVLANALKHLTNKRRIFLTEKRKNTVITRHSVRRYAHMLVQNSEIAGEDFIQKALDEMELYEKLKAEGKYKSAYKVAALTDKTMDYPPNIKKYLYYAAKRPITPENLEQTKKYFEYAAKYYSFKRKKREGGYVFVNDIDVVMARLIFMKNGGDVSREELMQQMHRTVKVYCAERLFQSVCLLADYLYSTGEIELEQMTLKILVHYGEAINDKYKKRYTFLELLNKDSHKFIFRHNPNEALECLDLDVNKNIEDMLKHALETKKKNSWCLAIKHTVKTYEFKYKYFYDDKLLNALETVLDNEFGDFVLEYSLRTFFDGDTCENAKNSMLIVTSGKNQYTDFPQIAILVKIEPITKNFVNVHYCVLYLPEDDYTKEALQEDCKYIESIISSETDSRFRTFSMVVENLVWNTVNDALNK